MMKMKFAYILVSVVAVTILVAATGIVYASPQTAVPLIAQGGITPNN